MTTRAPIWVSPSGEALEGTLANDVPLWDPTTREWVAGAIPFPPSGVPPFTQELFVDAGSASATEDGSVSSPYKTLQAAFDVVNAALGTDGWAIIVTPGDYSAEVLTLTPAASLFVHVRADQRFTQIGNLTVSTGGNVIFENIGFAGTVDWTGQFYLYRCSGGTHTANARLNCWECGPMGAVTFVPGANVNALTCYDSSFVDVVGFDALLAFDSIVGIVTGAAGAEAILHDSTAFGATFDATIGRLFNSSVSGVLTVTLLVADNFSLDFIRSAAAGAHAVATTTNADNGVYAGLVFAVPALAAAFADVNVAAPGARAGDSFAWSTDVLPADVGCVGVWVSASDQVTARFYGTTAGGNATLTLNRVLNSVVP